MLPYEIMSHSHLLPTSISEQEIRSFLQEAPQPRRPFRNSFSFLNMVGLITGLAFLVLNFSSILRVQNSLNFTWAKDAPTSTPAALPTAAPTSTAQPTPVIPSIPENTVSVPDLAISAPVHWNTALIEKTVQKQLASGVVHIAGTALPGQKGMVVITGHSSNYPWDKGLYNTVFAPLHKARVGQVVSLNYKNIEYTYKVSKIYEVKPTNLTVLEDGNETGIRFITCTPIGFTWRRLIVEATQITPDPNANTPFAHEKFSGSLPQAQ